MSQVFCRRGQYVSTHQYVLRSLSVQHPFGNRRNFQTAIAIFETTTKRWNNTMVRPLFTVGDLIEMKQQHKAYILQIDNSDDGLVSKVQYCDGGRSRGGNGVCVLRLLRGY